MNRQELNSLHTRWRQDLKFEEPVLGKTMQFTSTWGLFSPEKLDDGSLMLLDHMEFRKADSSIDLGCGYGILGMTAARECPEGQHLLIDKDFVAIEYAKKNCFDNRLSNTEVQLSNGFRHVDPARRFDLVMSNSGGRFYVVTINGLREFMQRTFKEVFGNSDKLKQGKTYTITMAQKD
jgi:16S rRNA (guanine1207-N2)-methyltransferase